MKMMKKFKKTMSKKNKNIEQPVQEPENLNKPDDLQDETQPQPENEEEAAADDLQAKIAELEAALEKKNNDYLLLMADFDNYRKRTLREKADLIKNGGERAMADLLPVIDDMERALAAMNDATDVDSLREGVELIHNKFMKYLEQNHVTPIDSTGKDFDTELHEAVTMFPAPSPELKGKVIDTTVKGYMLNDKVLRHAKVVVGQ